MLFNSLILQNEKNLFNLQDKAIKDANPCLNGDT